MEDVFLSFGHLGVHLSELEDYLKHVEPLPFAREVVAYPIPKRNNLQFPNPECSEIQNREEHIPDHLPLMYPTAEGMIYFIDIAGSIVNACMFIQVNYSQAKDLDLCM